MDGCQKEAGNFFDLLQKSWLSKKWGRFRKGGGINSETNLDTDFESWVFLVDRSSLSEVFFRRVALQISESYW